MARSDRSRLTPRAWLTLEGRRDEQRLSGSKRLAWTIFGLAASGSTALFFNIVLARSISPAQFGHVARTYAGGMIVAQLTMAGIAPTLMRFVAQGPTEESRHERARSAVVRLLKSVTPVAALYLVLAAAGLAPGDPLSLALGTFLAFVYPLYFGLKTILYGLSLIRTYAVLEVTSDLVFFGVLAFLTIAAPRFAILTFCIAYGGFSLVAFAYIRRSASTAVVQPPDWSMARFAALAMVATYASATQAYAVLLLTGVLSTSSAAGQLSAILVLTTPLALLPQAAGVLSFVSAARPAAGFEESLRQTVRVVAAVVGCACCIGTAFGYPLIDLILGPSFHKAVPSFLVLIIGVSALLGATPIGNALAGGGRVGTTAAISFAAFVSAVVAALVLVPAFGALGAALAISGACALSACLLLAVAHRRFDLRIADGLPALVLPAVGVGLARINLEVVARGAFVTVLVCSTIVATRVRIQSRAAQQ